MISLRRRSDPMVSPLARASLLLGSAVAALVVGALLIMLVHGNPIRGYQAMFLGAFGSWAGFIDVLVKATPILLTGLGTAVAFRSGQFNIGVDGQIYVGAMAATWVGITFRDLPAPLLLALSLLAGFCGGAAWALIPGYLKAVHGVGEVVPALMLNYVGALLVSFLVNGPWKQPKSFMPQTVQVAAKLPLLTPPPYRLHSGLILALVMAVLIWLLMERTSLGYSFRALGASPAAARYGGVNTRRTILLVMAISGGMSGLAGANEIVGFHYRLIDGFVAGLGFKGVLCTLLASLSSSGLTISSFLFSVLVVGAYNMQRVLQIPLAISDCVQGIVVLFVLGSRVLLEYRPSVTFGNLARRMGRGGLTPRPGPAEPPAGG